MSTAHEYLLAFMLEPLEKGSQFIGWPLHITLVPAWFRTSHKEAQIFYDINTVAEQFEPFTVRGVQRAQFGWRGSVAVTAIASSALHDLHRALLNGLKQGQYQLMNSKHMGESYQPHVTQKGNAEFKPGHELLLDRIYLTKAPISNPRTRTKTIVGVVEL